MTAALVVLLGLSAPLRAPDLQVEAATTAGTDFPELADAVARALVASGARVVLRGPSSGPCLYCAKVVIVEAAQGSCRVEVRQDVKQERHTAAATLHFPAGSQLFDRARAIAIQARLLVTWETNPETRNKQPSARSSTRKSERKSPLEQPVPEVQGAVTALVPAAPIKEAELVPGPGPVPGRIPDPASERHVDPVLVAPVTYVERTDSNKTEPVHAGAHRRPSAGVASVSLQPHAKQWPWIPTMVGSGAAIAAGICAVVARDRYNALSDKSQPFQAAQALKGEGQNWQVASFVLAGVAAAGLTTGLIGFVTRSSERSSLSAVATPIPGGGIVAVAGDWP